MYFLKKSRVKKKTDFQKNSKKLLTRDGKCDKITEQKKKSSPLSPCHIDAYGII